MVRFAGKIKCSKWKGCIDMKKIISILLIVVTLSLSVGTVISSASFGSGVAVMAEETRIIKSGIFGRKITFTDADIKQALCIDSFSKIKITKLPESSKGTLMLAGRRVSEGTVIKRKNLPSLVFIPYSADTKDASFYITVDGYGDGKEIEFQIKYTDKINYEPKIDTSASSEKITTQRDIGIYGKLSATDAESDALEYIIVSYPKSGTLTFVDKSTGEFLYTPQDSYVGSDSFSYVVRDEWGNYSSLATATVSVTKRMCETVYSDLTESKYYNAAVAMTAMGVMSGTVIGDGVYFMPEETVSREEFVTMAMKALGIRCDSTLTSTYFDDNGSIKSPLIPYVATAASVGAVLGNFSDGKLLFRPTDNITKYEAAAIVSALCDMDTKTSASLDAEIPVWARSSFAVMLEGGYFDADTDAQATLTKGECAEYLYRLIGAK